MQVALSWTASATPNVLWYNVYRSQFNGGPYQLIGTSNPNPMIGAPTPQITAPNALTTYTDITAPNGLTAYYVISAVTIDGESVYSTQYTANPPSAPAAPTGISAVIT